MQNSILVFLSLALGLGFTLILGPLWGVEVGLMTFLFGSNFLLNKEVVWLRQEIKNRLSELPEIVGDLTLQALIRKDASSSKNQGDSSLVLKVNERSETELAPKAINEQLEPAQGQDLTQKLTALDDKFDVLVQLLTQRNQAGSAPKNQEEPAAIDGVSQANHNQPQRAEEHQPTCENVNEKSVALTATTDNSSVTASKGSDEQRSSLEDQELTKKLTSLDDKFDALVQLLIAREQAGSAPENQEESVVIGGGSQEKCSLPQRGFEHSSIPVSVNEDTAELTITPDNPLVEAVAVKRRESEVTAHQPDSTELSERAELRSVLMKLTELLDKAEDSPTGEETTASGNKNSVTPMNKPNLAQLRPELVR